MQPASDSNQTPLDNMPATDDLYALLAENCRAQTTHAQTLGAVTKRRDESLHMTESVRQQAVEGAASQNHETHDSAKQHLERRKTAANEALGTVESAVMGTSWPAEVGFIGEPPSPVEPSKPSGETLQTLRTRAGDIQQRMQRLRVDLFHLREKRKARNQAIVLSAPIMIGLLILGAWLTINSIQTANANASANLATGTAVANANAKATQISITATVYMHTVSIPAVRIFGDVPMVLVPPGCFIMDSDGTDGNSNEQPVNRQCFDQPFWIDQTDVTNAEFAKFGGQAASSSNWTDANRPRESINWFEARDFCAKRDARLPTEAEWEYAARGPNNLVYPWGNSFDPNKVVFTDNSNYQTANVGSKPGGASWVGAYDIVGNVWQWTSSIYKPYPYSAADGREDNSDTHSGRVLRGGSWSDNNINVRAALRFNLGPSLIGNTIGFRCARSF